MMTQAGFSLVEVMVGGGLLAGVGLAGAYMMKQQRTAQKKVDSEQQLLAYHQGLIKTLNNSQNCNATFKTWYGAAIPAPTDISAINKCGAVNGVAADCTATGNIKNDASAITAVTAVLTPGATAWTDNTETWYVDKITIQANPAGGANYNKTGAIPLRITYKMNPRLDANRTVLKDLYVNARFKNTGAFMECTNGQESSLNNLQNELCKTMNTNQISSAGAVVKWNEDTQKCDLVGSTASPLKSCPQGYVIEGVRSDGTVHCRSVSAGFTGASGTASPTNCATGTKTVFDTATNSFTVQCN